ncbi:M14 family metallopeptidase [Sorangium sp. So ce513]|uniref:M14 family metallopeptidase n=1 Tax=Sorangium sp. So ce513 TaxID=3133315 RepID=UPI003F60A3C8
MPKSDQGSEEQGRAALRAALFVHRRAPLSRQLARRGLGPYRGYGELLEALDRLADRGAQLSLIGRSVRGEPLLAVQLGAATKAGAGGYREGAGGHREGAGGHREGAGGHREGAGASAPPGQQGSSRGGEGPRRSEGLLNGAPVAGASRGLGAPGDADEPAPDDAATAQPGEPSTAIERRGHGGAGRERARTTVILSGIHPLEWIGIETHLALLERLAAEDLGGRSIFAVPIVNPDGLLRVEMNLRAGRHRYVRGNARGVDLNRNFDAGWYERGLVQRLIGLVSSPGSRPASEPEVEAIAHALSSRRIDRALSLHSAGGAVLYPPAHSLWPVADAAEHRAFAQRVARAADRRPYRAMSYVRFAWCIRKAGLEIDWLHDRHGALSLLVECSRGKLGLRPSRLVEPFAWYNPRKLDDAAPQLVQAVLPFVKGARA